MDNAHKRKKQPELVRRALIDQAARLAVEGGLTAVTIQAVSDAAGVTKGGCMHHFPHKQALIDAVFEHLLAAFGAELDGLMAADPEPVGAFTRAYIQATLDIDWEGAHSPQGPLSVLLMGDAHLRGMWAPWFQARMARHQESDGSLSLALVRLAVDGVWLADLVGNALPDRQMLRATLLAATLPAPTPSKKRARGKA
jgi:AcrR family transcriptional regulator